MAPSASTSTGPVPRAVRPPPRWSWLWATAALGLAAALVHHRGEPPPVRAPRDAVRPPDAAPPSVPKPRRSPPGGDDAPSARGITPPAAPPARSSADPGTDTGSGSPAAAPRRVFSSDPDGQRALRGFLAREIKPCLDDALLPAAGTPAKFTLTARAAPDPDTGADPALWPVELLTASVKGVPAGLAAACIDEAFAGLHLAPAADGAPLTLDLRIAVMHP